MKTPVVLLIFNRPDTTQRVLDVVRLVKPPQLLVVADGPRSDRPQEAERCAATRAVLQQVDWNCDLLTNYSEINLGCARRVASGLDWVFSQVEEAIILEDDCVPHPTFFPFCEELLERYRDDERVMTIAAKNVQFGHTQTEYSYYFSRYNHCWGWASWRRAWNQFDFDMTDWPTVKANNLLMDILQDKRAVQYWTTIFQSTYEGKTRSWAYRWMLSSWLQNGLSILPHVNLVSNIGFGTEATNTVTASENSSYANMVAEEMVFPLRHPPYMVRHQRADDYEQNTLFNPSLITRARAKLSRIAKKRLGL